jgi:hypothetical protein
MRSKRGGWFLNDLRIISTVADSKWKLSSVVKITRKRPLPPWRCDFLCTWARRRLLFTDAFKSRGASLNSGTPSTHELDALTSQDNEIDTVFRVLLGISKRRVARLRAFKQDTNVRGAGKHVRNHLLPRFFSIGKVMTAHS